MNIEGIKGLEDTLIDYPGNPAIIVYFYGCNFRCGFCHNIGLVTREDGPDIPWPKVQELIADRINLIEAIVISGGEPTINPGLEDFLRYAKDLELLTKLDTNGTQPQVIERLLEENLLDHIAMDVKHELNRRYYVATGMGNLGQTVVGADPSLSDEETVGAALCGRPRAHQRAAHVDLGSIKQSIDLIKNSGIDYEFRTTVMPNLHEPEEVINIARQLQGAKKYVLQNFVAREEHIDPAYVERKGFAEDELKAMAKKCSEFVATEIRGQKNSS